MGDVPSLGSGNGIVILPSIIRKVVEVEHHAYRAASGEMMFVRNLKVIFLSHPLRRDGAVPPST